MENLLYGFQALTYGIRLTILSLLHNQMVWGFLFGFIVATIIHIFIVTDLMYSFKNILGEGVKKPPSTQRKVALLHTLFYCMFILFLVLLIILLLRF